MIHLYLMLYIVMHILWVCIFVMVKTCEQSDEIWAMLK